MRGAYHIINTKLKNQISNQIGGLFASAQNHRNALGIVVIPSLFSLCVCV